jgi:hypothetical protein
MKSATSLPALPPCFSDACCTCCRPRRPRFRPSKKPNGARAESPPTGFTARDGLTNGRCMPGAPVSRRICVTADPTSRSSDRPGERLATRLPAFSFRVLDLTTASPGVRRQLARRSSNCSDRSCGIGPGCSFLWTSSAIFPAAASTLAGAITVEARWPHYCRPKKEAPCILSAAN